jgi:hypothetical protein
VGKSRLSKRRLPRGAPCSPRGRRRNAVAGAAFVLPVSLMSFAVFEYVFEVQPEARGWRLTSASLASATFFKTFAQAEHRARWLAVRQEVRGYPSVIRMLAESGDLVGVWRGERYEPILTDEVCHAA